MKTHTDIKIWLIASILMFFFTIMPYSDKHKFHKFWLLYFFRLLKWYLLAMGFICIFIFFRILIVYGDHYDRDSILVLMGYPIMGTFIVTFFLLKIGRLRRLFRILINRAQNFEARKRTFSSNGRKSQIYLVEILPFSIGIGFVLGSLLFSINYSFPIADMQRECSEVASFPKVRRGTSIVLKEPVHGKTTFHFSRGDGIDTSKLAVGAPICVVIRTGYFGFRGILEFEQQ